MTGEKAVLDAVEDFVFRRHESLTRHNVMGFVGEDLDRLKVDEQGYLVFTVEDMHITETEVEYDTTFYYVAATLIFQVESGEPIESDEETYQAYLCDNGWNVQWYAS